MREIAAEARRFLEASAPLGSGYDDGVYRKMAELGWLGVAVPEEHGGLGLGASALCALAHEAGRVVLSSPFLLTAALAAPLLAEGGDSLLPYVLSGESVLAVATEGVTIDGKRCRGAASAVIDAEGSEHVLVIDGDRLAFVDTANTVVDPLEWIDLSRRVARVRFDDVPVVAMLRAVPSLDLARVALAAESLGCAERALEMAVEYAKVRVQFDKPIGAFQAVQHLLAQMLERVELLRATVDGAARAIDAAPASDDAHHAALLAKAAAAESAVRVTADAIQVFGGIGYTWEHPAHRFYRRAVGNASLYGDASWCRERLASSVL